MGWAKYQEDIASRRINDTYKPARQPAAATPSSPPNTTQQGASGTMNQEKPVKKLKEFTVSSARPLPVIVLADVSTSMAGSGKIDALNSAVAEMLATFAEEDASRAEIHVSIITFGDGGARVHKPLAPASRMQWEPMTASGRTPMGEAFTLARRLLEDREVIPSRAYRPTVVLVSDGVPTGDWHAPLDALLQSDRGAKASRLAIGIGADADHETLTAFLADPEGRVFEAHEAREIRRFFRWVTMSVTARTRSASPDSVVAVEPTDLDDLDF